MVVVGGSLAGLRAIETLRNEGFEGRVTLIGAETRQPYDRPPLSKKVLAGEWEPERIALRRDGDLGSLDVDAAARPDRHRARCGRAGRVPWTTASACPTTA